MSVLDGASDDKEANRPPTIQDVADALGIHKSTVSVALSGKGTLSESTRSRILSVAQSMGYEPNPLAQRLANGFANPAVCIFSGILDVGLGTEKILVIQRELSKLALEVPIYTCSETTADAGRSQVTQVRQICRQRPRAIICAAQNVDHGVYEELGAYQQAGGIVVSYDIQVPLACDQVIFDREDNAYRAARCLLEAGHRKIGLSMPNTVDWLPYSPSFPQPSRIRGFKRALEEFGVPFRPEWLFQHTTYERGGEELARSFLGLSERPTGLCIINDYVALAFMVEVMRQGVRIPEDLSVVGHDNQRIADYCPIPLTSATHPVDEIIGQVVRYLSDRLYGVADAPRCAVIAGRLVERSSVSPISSAD